MKNSASVKENLIELIGSHLPGFRKETGQRLPLFWGSLKRGGCDLITFNRTNGFYERLFLEQNNVESIGHLLGVQCGVSVLPIPQLPSGPLGWDADSLTLSRISNGSLRPFLWSGPWLRLGENMESARDTLNAIFLVFSSSLPQILERAAAELLEKEQIVEIKTKLHALRIRFGDSLKELRLSSPDTLEQVLRQEGVDEETLAQYREWFFVGFGNDRKGINWVKSKNAVQDWIA